MELDRDLVAGLQQTFGSHPKFSLQEGDVLSVPLELSDGVPADKVVANIPYNITGPLLDRLIGRLDRPVDPSYQRLVLLVQHEVAQRIRARPGHSNFSALSVRMQLLGRCSHVCPVPPRCFQPPPKVQSEVICIDPFPAELRPSCCLGPWGGTSAQDGLLESPQNAAQHPGPGVLPRPLASVGRRGRHQPSATTPGRGTRSLGCPSEGFESVRLCCLIG